MSTDPVTSPRYVAPEGRRFKKTALAVAAVALCLMPAAGCASSDLSWTDIAGTWVGDDGATVVIHKDGTCEATNVNVHRITKDVSEPDITKASPACDLLEETPEVYRDFSLGIDHYGINVKVVGRGKDQHLEVYRFHGDPDDRSDIYRLNRR